MLLWLLNLLTSYQPDSSMAELLAPLDKITLRASLAAVMSFTLSLVCGARLIDWLGKRFREPIRCDSAQILQLHQAKESTPTMGGLLVVTAILAAALAWGDLANPYTLLAMLVLAAMAALGAVDDLAKIFTSSGGLPVWVKLAGQVVVALVVAILIYKIHARMPQGLDLVLPPAGWTYSLGWWFVPLAVVVIVGSSNAVNLTDGLDGLAGGCLLFALSGMAILAYVAGHAELAGYLNVPRIPGAGEIVIVMAAAVGGVLGFLWFNCHPAQVFMGDTGSLPLGGLLGLAAVAARQELLLIVVGGVFVVEALSVIIQVGYFKWTRRRVFLCAPLHHHFQLRGWPEGKIVVRFWIASALCAVLGVAGMKLTLGNDTGRASTVDSAQRFSKQVTVDRLR